MINTDTKTSSIDTPEAIAVRKSLLEQILAQGYVRTLSQEEAVELLIEGQSSLQKLGEEKLARRDFHGYLYTFDRNEGFDRLKEIEEYAGENRIRISSTKWAKLVRHAWEGTDRSQADLWGWGDTMEFTNAKHFMTGSEKRKLAEMPDEVTLYRGYCEEFGNDFGISWTPDKELATFFSTYRTRRPAIREITIDKRMVYAYIDAREGTEPEVMILPELLNDFLNGYQIEFGDPS